MIAIVVTCCADCPFASEDRAGAGGRKEPWLCDALGATDGETDPREIPSTSTPEWCPLRRDDRVIKLRPPR